MLLSNRKFWLAITAVLVLIGLAGAINIVINGEHVLGTSDQIPWGALIAGYVFFVVSSTGLSLVSSLGHVFHIKQFEILGKRAVLGAIITLLMGFVVIGLELGKPFNLIHILFSPNFKSAIFWMGLLYGIYLVLLCVEFFFMLKGDHKKSRIVAILVLISAIAAHSNLGAVFGFLVARPYWTGPYMSIYFILSALLSGSAILAIIFYLVSKVRKNEPVVYNNQHVVTSLGKLLILFIGITIFFTVWKILTGVYGAVPGKFEGIQALLTGPLAWRFWIFEIGFGMLIPLILLSLPKGLTPRRVFIASSLVVIGIFFMRIDLVFAGQITPITMFSDKALTYLPFAIEWSEWALLFGAIGGAILLYLIGEKVWNLTMKFSPQENA